MGLLDKVKQKVIKIEPSLPYDFTEYTEFKDMIGYIGFITPKGTFYRVRQIGKANGGHGEWAYGFLYNLGLRCSMTNLNANTIELLNNPKFNFTMLFEDLQRENICFLPGCNGLTKEQLGVINTLRLSENFSEEADYSNLR